MPADDLRDLLEQVQAGRISVDDALGRWRDTASVDLGYANVDLNRRERCGFPEVIYCQGKTPEWIAGVVRRLVDAGQDCLATRVDDEQATHLARLFPAANQDRVARTFWLPSGDRPPELGRVVVLTAGTSDLPVAREALVTAQSLGTEADLIADVGVAGLHRLLRHRERFSSADAIVAVAGMGRCVAERGRRTRGLSRDCGSDERGLWCELRRRRGSSDDVECMLGGSGRRQHR